MALAENYPARLVCRATGWPRSSLYLRADPPADEGRLRQAVARLAGEWPTYGYRRLTALLRREGWRVNGKRVRRVMAELGIQGKAPARRVRTTDSAHAFPRHPNRVAGLEVVRPDQVWVADITYVRLRSEFVYLAVLMDVFTRCVRGWELGRSLDQGLTLGALGRALRGPAARGPPLRPGGAVRGDGLRRAAGSGRGGDQHGGGRRAGGERLRRAADADDQGGGSRPVGVRGLRGRPAAAGPVPRRRVQPEADSFVVGLPDAERVRAAD